MPERCLFPGTKELSLAAGRTRTTFAEQVRLTREQGQKILLIDKITLKKASYPTKLLIFVINNIVIGKIYGT